MPIDFFPWGQLGRFNEHDRHFELMLSNFVETFNNIYTDMYY